MLVTLGVAADASLAVEGPRPNILLIVTDDQRPNGTMEVMPQTRSWFEAGGTNFTQAYATTPLCCPSRSSIFSGQYTHNHGVRTLELSQALDQRFTIQEYLRQSGYRTAIFGKYLNDWNLFRDPPSFDDWAISIAGYNNFRANEQGVVKGITQYATSYYRDKAVQFIQNSESQDTTPWFMEVATTAPHSPFTPEPKYANAPVPPFDPPPNYFEADKQDKPVSIANSNFDPAAIESVRVAQLRTLMSVDDLVGDVFSTLQADGEESEHARDFHVRQRIRLGRARPHTQGRPLRRLDPDPDVHAVARSRNRGRDRFQARCQHRRGADDRRRGRRTPGGTPDGRANDAQPCGEPLAIAVGVVRGFRRTGLGVAADTHVALHRALRQDDSQTITFREYYDLTADPWEMDNLLGDGNPANDPPTAALSAQLAADRNCVGSSCP